MLLRLLPVFFVSLPLLISTGAIANPNPNLLTDRWISCSENSQTRTTSGAIALRSECLYQEIQVTPGADLDLTCDIRTANFTSIQLAHSDENFNTLNSASETTSTNSILRVNAGRAPQNTRYAVATLYTDSQATMNCSLSATDADSNPVVSAGVCIDSDNDGYGWNGVSSCTPVSSQPIDTIPGTTTDATPDATPTAGACIDTDNDGYGWNGFATCTMAGSSNPDSSGNNSNDPVPADSSASETVAGACIDSDNDGYGWNGVATCIITGVLNRTPSADTEASTPQLGDLTDLILITGQSNAQGAQTTVSLTVLDAPDSRVFAFTDTDGWQVADLRQHWDGPDQPRHPGNNALLFSANTPHNNFAFHFAKSLVEIDPNRVVGFVLLTAPGAGIRQWDRGSSLYNTLSNKAMTALNASNKTTFDGVLWHQGETDFLYNGTSDITSPASERLLPNYYPQRLYALIRNLRQEAWFSTNKAVFICGETQKTNSDTTEIAPVNQRLMEINNDTDRYTGCVSSDNLATTDGVHFNAASLREIGRRYAEKYLQLKNN